LPIGARSGQSIRRIAAGIALLISAAASPPEAAEEAKSQWVYAGPDGKLVYKTTPAGDKIMDFSSAGYRGGGVALPNVPVRLTVQPSGNDDEARRQ